MTQLMPKQDKATVRRILEAVLNRLDAEARGGEENSNSILLSESGDADAPVILVVIAGSNSTAKNGTATPALRVDRAGQPATNYALGNNEAQAAHPGLERFPLAVTDPHPSAPKACFMEPGRACVSSGACEMRGF